MPAPDHTELLLAARAAHHRRDWQASYAMYDQARTITSLPTDDLEALAFAAWRVGHIKESSRAAEQVFTELTRTDPMAAATKALELGLAWLVRGDVTIGSGWINRGRRLLTGAPDGTAHAYLHYLDAAAAAIAQDFDGLRKHVNALAELRTRVDEPTINALGLIAAGVEAILHARTTDGYALIDEATLPLLADQVPIEWAGDIYCMVLHHCHKLADLPRMRAWTTSMERWCGLSGSVPYGGVCDVHRLQLRVATDDYRELERQLVPASAALAEINAWAAAEGYYQLGEVRRLLGDLDGAAAAFAEVRLLGVDPQPGAALLACRRGDRQEAWVSVQLALADGDRLARVRTLRAAVEIALTQSEFDQAENYCRELESEALAFGTPGFLAWASHARGAVCVRRGHYDAALEVLQTALREYRTQQSRYEMAEVYEWMALARRGLGESAAADIAAAEAIYAQLGVEPAGICGSSAPGGLTRREVEVLTAIADGATNRQVAQQLQLSDKTVSRHLANIYTKLDVSSRTAAAAWARENKLVR